MVMSEAHLGILITTFHNLIMLLMLFIYIYPVTASIATTPQPPSLKKKNSQRNWGTSLYRKNDKDPSMWLKWNGFRQFVISFVEINKCPVEYFLIFNICQVSCMITSYISFGVSIFYIQQYILKVFYLNSEYFLYDKNLFFRIIITNAVI